jgi:hypothetical protein
MTQLPKQTVQKIKAAMAQAPRRQVEDLYSYLRGVLQVANTKEVKHEQRETTKD